MSGMFGTDCGRFLVFICLVIFIGTGFGCFQKEHQVIDSVKFDSKEPVSGFDYIPVEEFLKTHPQEIVKTISFEKVVASSPVPLEGKHEVISVAVVFPGEQVSDYWRRNLRAFSARLKALNVPFTMKTFFSKAGGIDQFRQEQQLREAMSGKPDYLVFTLNIKMHKKAIDKILTKGEPRLFLQNVTMPLKEWSGRHPFYVGFDHIQGTKLLADYFTSVLTKKAPYGILYHSLGYVSEMRGTSFLHMMREAGWSNPVGSYYTDGVRDRARIATLDLLSAHKPTFVYACSTDVAFGVVDALRDRNLKGQVMVNGWGGGSAELKALEAGELAVTVMRMNDDAGIAMAEAIKLEMQGKTNEVPTVYSGRFELITQKTPSAEIERLKSVAFRYSDSPDDEE